VHWTASTDKRAQKMQVQNSILQCLLHCQPMFLHRHNEYTTEHYSFIVYYTTQAARRIQLYTNVNTTKHKKTKTNYD